MPVLQRIKSMKWKHDVLKRVGDKLLKLCVGLLIAGGVIVLVGFKVEVCSIIGAIMAMEGAMVFIYLLGAQAADKDIAKVEAEVVKGEEVSSRT